MEEREYLYTSPQIFKDLAQILLPEQLEVFVTLEANVPDRFRELQDQVGKYGWSGETKEERRRKIERQAVALKYLLEVAHEHKVHPLTSYSFRWDDGKSPRHEHIKLDATFHEVYVRYTRPAQLMLPHRYSGLSFTGHDQVTIDAFKEFVAGIDFDAY